MSKTSIDRLTYLMSCWMGGMTDSDILESNAQLTRDDLERYRSEVDARWMEIQAQLDLSTVLVPSVVFEPTGQVTLSQDGESYD